MSHEPNGRVTTMRASVYDRYGSPDVLELRDVPTPTCSDDHLLVRVRAAAANPFDWHLLRGDPYLVHLAMGLGKPRRAKILGSDVAGVVEIEIGRASCRERVSSVV